MVTSVNPPENTHTGTVPFSLAREQLDRTQVVSAVLGGLEYPGEVIVASDWQSEFGETLNGVSMFRLVLLQSSSGPSSRQINDRRICVAVQDSPEPAGRRIGESSAIYNVANNDEDRAQTRRSAEADIRSIREVRSSYVTAGDPGLSRLLSSLVEYESKINESLVGDSHLLWKSGTVVTSESFERPAIRSGQVFLLNDPVSWLEVAASNVIDRSQFPVNGPSPAEIYGELQAGKLKIAREHLRAACGLRIDTPTPTESIQRLANPASGEIHADDVIDLLIHDLALPPTIASLWVLVYTLESESELELVRETAERIFVSSDNISEFALGEVAIDRITHIRGDKSLGWDAVLPFLQLIVPHANSTRYGGGRDSDVEEFNRQLATIGDRVAQSLPIMLSLEIAVGATDRPLTSVSSRLLKALGAGTWQAYVASARLLYGSVAALRSSIAEAARHWAVVDVVPEIERTIYYLDRVEFGRIDHALSIEHQLLRSRFELNFLIENPSNWFSLRGEFEHWCQDYRRAYLEDHAQKQSHNRLLKEDIDHTNRLVTQLAMLDQVEAIRTVDESNIAELWEQTIRSFAVCENDGSLIPLVDEPLCTGCNARLGQPTNHTDIAGMISEVQHVFSGYRDRLARIVSDLVLNSPDADKLQSLFRLNSAGDLSDLANVLDDKVISFLNELFGKTSGNIDDWTSPHS